MIVRVLSAVVGIPLFIGICVWGIAPFCIGLILLAALGLSEMIGAYWRMEILPNPLLCLLGLAGPAIPLIRRAEIPSAEIVFAVVCIVVAAMLWETVQCAASGDLHAGRNLGYGALCGGYIALFGGLTQLRDPIGAVVASGGWQGMLHLDDASAQVLLVVSCVWATDSFAFFTGSAFGRHKLAPRLSPGKTIEGAIGGLAASLMIGTLLGPLLLGSLPAGLAAGAIAGTLGQAGDLFESALKREAGVKDFGGMLPGHGGVLDRFDSLLFVAPAAAVILPLVLR